EGDLDEAVLNHVANVIGRGILKFVTLPNLQSDESSGVDSLISYIRKNSRLLSRRPKDCPLLVLVDWEVSESKINTLIQHYGERGDRYVVRADPSFCFNELGPTFVGLERFYCPHVIQASHEAGECAVAFPENGNPWSIERGQLMQAKGRWAQRMLKVNDVTRLSPLIKLVEQVYEAATQATNDQLRLIM